MVFAVCSSRRLAAFLSTVFRLDSGNMFFRHVNEFCRWTMGYGKSRRAVEIGTVKIQLSVELFCFVGGGV